MSVSHEQLQSLAIQALSDIAKGGPSSSLLAKGGAGFSGDGEGMGPKSFFTDPYQYLEHVGIGYREIPHELTYGTLKAMADRNTVVSAVIHTRKEQVANFCHRPENKYSIGFQVGHKDRKRKLTPGEKMFCHDIEENLINSGVDRNDERDGLETLVKKIVVDSLRYDQVNLEVKPRINGLPHSWYAVDAATIRWLRSKRRKGGPSQTYSDYRKPRYCQVIEGRIVSEYTEDELCFAVRNPRTDIYQGGYGRSELEDLIMTVTSHLWAEEWNRKIFSQGTTTKGVFLVKGNVPPAQMEAFRRMWAQQISGVSNAWKTPILNSEDATWISMQPNNQEMGFQAWLEYLIKITCAIYQIDPAEVNFDLRGGSGMQQPLFMTTNEAQQKVSKDRGLTPLLRFIANVFNKSIISKIDPNYEMRFVGIDQKSEEQAIELQLKEVKSKKTLNEVRAEDDLPPLPGGDVVLDPVYTANLQAQQMAEAAQAQGGQPGQPGQPGQQPMRPPKVPPVPAEGKQREEKVEFPFASVERDAGAHINYVAGEGQPGGEMGGADFAAAIKNRFRKTRRKAVRSDRLSKSIYALQEIHL